MAMTKEKDAAGVEPIETTLPPWKSQPHLYRDRQHLAEVILDASETSSYYDGMRLATQEELNERKKKILDELRRLYPQD